MSSILNWPNLLWALVLAGAVCIFAAFLLLHALIQSHITKVPKWRSRYSSVHLLVVLGSGGHTAEMFSMLRRVKLDPTRYTHRTYVVSSGDNFSAKKAVEFERTYLTQKDESSATAKGQLSPTGSFSIVTVPRARRVHQSYLTAPFSTLGSFWSCLLVLRGLHPDQKHIPPQPSHSRYPDIILTNGPATAVCVILAARLLRLWHALHVAVGLGSHSGSDTTLSSDFKLRTIFVESWARVTTLSLSGKLLLPFADRFLVQWPELAGRKAWRGMRQAEYVGTLVD
ncbi:glycosyltransferase family protein [Aspergillus saccharolyticus JOP 1030-1]|uniref:UDP-N-acetylglucosamine transferase subunit ALG14 n=1 Tax=Aspergillus saccharolyticus JOP 1030-1 TaxID=1450539 RepID=A0A318ZEY9_9EURO|nr:oligosaccharide biosynthesis protein Alg14 like protein [Aspergillus saccharolyticus JOP 1030-1]PYH46106.1 oligosaccharide biosynthesis protein Alg14 like protein [Aspergillus saccharolyticus JOP 1030-1]